MNIYDYVIVGGGSAGSASNGNDAPAVGPTLGGVFASLGIWRGIFLVNIPLCMVAGWMLLRSFHENVERAKHRVDYLGAGLLTVSLTLAILRWWPGAAIRAIS